jgi:hypothetical protein
VLAKLGRHEQALEDVNEAVRVLARKVCNSHPPSAASLSHVGLPTKSHAVGWHETGKGCLCYDFLDYLYYFFRR